MKQACKQIEQKLAVLSQQHGFRRIPIRTLSTFKPIIIHEVVSERTAALGLSPRGAWDFLHQFGYQFFAIAPSGELTRQKSPPVNRNVVAVHRTQEGRLDS